MAMFKGGVDEMNPLHLAAQRNHTNCKNVTRQDIAEGNCHECIVTLLENKPPVQDDTDAWKQSPIQTALTKRCYDCTLILLESDSVTFSPETADEFKKPLVSYLNQNDNEHRRIGERLLMKHYKKFETQNIAGDNILHLAIKFLESIFDLHHLRKWLKDPPVDDKNSQNQTPLYLAVSAKKPRLARYLIMAGASSLVSDNKGISPMILSCQLGDASSARILLLDDKYRGNERDKKSKTALHHAASSSKWPDENDCLDIVERLADVMKSINVPNQEDETPLQSAFEANRKPVCITLLRRKASIKLANVSKLSALNDIVQSEPEMNFQSDLETEKKLRTEWAN
ncbi:serine threonine protein phosphatase [Fusarium langsethiae]|uniref:Serine threonine protein phosphatase n=1 Tax=Fusarium langsethiae TaxID=179993 RepID=A0A0M9ETQ6_FUSLA|nr:serine threonine protein phosphatase [Fusarium langsethiae]GKU04916.1 unnamed protein product [Fusarium langsethiae]GKU22026.1 unnamed protein product [Fusarium langsethiae]